MSKSDIVLNIQYKTPSSKSKALKRWINYVTDKQKADDYSIDEYNVLKGYVLYNNKDFYLSEHDETFLWNRNGDFLNKDAINQIKNMDYKGTYMRGFLSFPSDFALSHGLIDKSDYYSLSNNVINKFILDLGLNINNVEWYCALHRNTPTHPHIHFCIYEKKETLKQLKAPLYTINNFRSNVAKYLVNYEKFYKLRDKTFKDITKKINLNEFNEIKAQRLFSDSYRSNLNKKLVELYSKLPSTGRLQYNSNNLSNVKDDIDEIINFILEHNCIKYEYARYIKLLEQHQKELNSLYGMSDSNMNKKYYNEHIDKLYSKIANEILRNYKIYQSKSFFERDIDFLNKCISNMNFKSRKDYVKEQTKISIAKDLYRICIMANLNENQIKKVFNRWIKNSRYDMDTDTLLLSIKNLDTTMTVQEFYNALKKLGYPPKRFNALRSKNFYKQLEYKRFIDSAIDHLMYELSREEKEIINQLEYELDEYY